MVIVEISSSDSDFDSDLDDDSETGISFSATRRLPDWQSKSSLNARTPEIGASSHVTRKLPSWQTTSSLNVRAEGKRGNSQRVSSPKRVSHNDADKRSLPASFHSSVSQAKPNVKKGPGTSLLNVKDNGEENITRGIHNDVTLLDKSSSRILPRWMRPSPISSGRDAKFTDLLDPFRTTDEKMAGPDETSVFQAVVQDLNQPKQEVDIPDGLLSVPLLRHQKIALAWMCQKEARHFCVGGILADDQGLGKTVSTIALVLMHKHSEQKSKSGEQHTHKTESLNLDEDEDNEITSLDDVELKEDSKGISSSSKACSSYKQRATAGTLVVCPATLLRQWIRELNDKVTEESKLEVLMYHGGNRTKDPAELAKYDVVVTTYSIVTNEVPNQPLVDEDDAERKAKEKYGSPAEISLDKNKNSSSSRKKRKKGKGTNSCLSEGDSGALARVSWLRVVLDEAQTIKNHRTKVARACWGLRAKKRWCLSGTPIQNTIDELFSYFRFLKYDPYSSYKAFCEGIKVPISRDSQYGYQKLQAVLRTVMLRRTKGTLIDGDPVINLPPKFIKMKIVDFTLEERLFYAKLEAESRSQYKAYALAGTVRQNYANILLMLLRLRLACDHPLLAQRLGSDSSRKVSSIKTLIKPTEDTLMNLLNCLESSRICQLCADPPEDAVVAMCGHVFCDQCLSDRLSGDDITCPARRCRKQLEDDVIFSEATIRSWLSDGSESSLSKCDQRDGSSVILSSEFCSAKIKAALEILQSLGESSTTPVDLDDKTYNNGDSVVRVRTQTLQSTPSGRPKKAIVFSQWIRMLDLVETALQQSNFEYRRLDGTMSLAARDKAVGEFTSDPEVTVMLMSLKAGNLGLNMVVACHVILLDLWWNPTTEDQAVDRAHRIGQTHPVTVSRLTIKDTVEDRILALQEQKRKMIASAFGEENGDVSASRLNLHDLKYLFTGAR